MNKNTFHLYGEPMEVGLEKDYIVKGDLPANLRIEHVVDGKVKGYLEVKFNTIENEEVKILQSAKITKCLANQKYKTELNKKLNEFVEGKLLDTLSDENIQIGSFYHGEWFNGHSNITPRRITILEKELLPIANFGDQTIYKHEDKLLISINLYNQVPLEGIKHFLRVNHSLFHEPQSEFLFVIDGPKLYVEHGSML